MLPDFYPALVARIRSRLVPDPARAACRVFPQKRGRHARIKFNGKLYSPHRVIAEWKHGELFPRNIDACHTCDNQRCCEEAHLFRGTRRDNVIDALQKGRHAVPANAARRARKLSDESVRAIRRAHESGQSARSLAREHRVSHSSVYELLEGTRYRDVPDAVRPVQVPLLPTPANAREAKR